MLPIATLYIQYVGYPLRFTWDQQKSAANLLMRGFDFEFAAQIFEGPTLEREDDRRDYGERRCLAIGQPMESLSPWSSPIGPSAAKSSVESRGPSEQPV